jgi:hypothetical protein
MFWTITGTLLFIWLLGIATALGVAAFVPFIVVLVAATALVLAIQGRRLI